MSTRLRATEVARTFTPGQLAAAIRTLAATSSSFPRRSCRIVIYLPPHIQSRLWVVTCVTSHISGTQRGYNVVVPQLYKARPMLENYIDVIEASKILDVHPETV